jgi:hypothetical protein
LFISQERKAVRLGRYQYSVVGLKYVPKWGRATGRWIEGAYSCLTTKQEFVFIVLLLWLYIYFFQE